jgi:deazaflavin-dependent oxidoreductase (nitroreductase family)
MASSARPVEIIWRIMRWLNLRLMVRFKSGGKTGQMVLLLTTIGRNSGQPHVTPLQYERLDGEIYIGSARGSKADWFRNILAYPMVKVEIGGKELSVQAEAITDPVRIADFFEFRLKRHPRMIGTLLRLEGLPRRYTRAELEEFASKKAIVILHPSPDNFPPVSDT